MLRLLLLSVAFTVHVCAQQAEDANLACVKSLVMPAYPPTAKQARAAGLFSAKVVVSSTGRAAEVTIEQTSKGGLTQAFVGAIDAKLRAAQFEIGCQGKTVRLMFSFELQDDLPAANTYNAPDRILFKGPNVFVIGAPPQLINF